MARRSRDEAAATLAVRELKELPVRGSLAVFEDPLALVAEAAEREGVRVEPWSRRVPGADLHPPEGPYDAVALRLPRAREEFEMLLHLAAARLRPGGRLLVYGANDEGIKSAAKRIQPLFGDVTTLATGGHARLLGAARPEELDPAELRSTVEAWRTVDEIRVPWRGGDGTGDGGAVPWVSYPGVFAHQRLDGGTQLLLEHLPMTELVDHSGLRALDWGAGSGFLAAGVLAAAPGADVTMVELDALALAAARENVPGAHAVQGDGWSALAGADPFDVVVANPPYHRGKEESMAEVSRLLAGVASGVASRGVVRFVVQRRLAVESALEHTFRRVDIVADRGAYRVWEGRR